MPFKVTDVITIIGIKELNIIERTSREIPAEIGEEVERYWADFFSNEIRDIRTGKYEIGCNLRVYLSLQPFSFFANILEEV